MWPRIVGSLLFYLLTVLTTSEAQIRFGGSTQWDPYDPAFWSFKYNYYECPPGQEWDPECYEPPYYPYDPIELYLDPIGWVVGRSMIYHQHKYINHFVGVPYAKPPLWDLRFKPPEDVGERWDENVEKWQANYYRDACPQELWQYDDKYYEPRNMSENCLHMNIFAPNITYHNTREYPVMVFLPGYDYKEGDAMLYPGHLVAEKEVVMITLNYRLGAIGFMSTLDEHSPGNYGMMDVVKALEFIQKYIPLFGGDKNQITLAGTGSGAGIVSLLILSPHSKSPPSNTPLFHRVILMTGSDMCEWSYVGQMLDSNALEYTKDLGREVGCDPDYGLSNKDLVECLRFKHHEEIVNASASVYKKYGSLSGPFGPVVDGDILPKSPQELREDKNFMAVPILAGLTKDLGAYVVENITKDMTGLDLNEGLDPETFRQIIQEMIRQRPAIRNVKEVWGALEFEYTFWAKPDNTTAVRQNLVDMWSDMLFGWCLDSVLKSHMDVHRDKDIYMYMFDHRSDHEVLPRWMGVPYHKDVDYLFGAPFFNETLGNITGIVPDQWDWDYLDKNISDFVTEMWVNFTKYGVPMTQWTRNTTWYPMTMTNLSYLYIHEEWSRMEVNMRQSHYGFWRVYFPIVASRWPVTTTPQPTPSPLIQYEIATWSLVGVCLITACILVGLGITLWKRMRSSL